MKSTDDKYLIRSHTGLLEWLVWAASEPHTLGDFRVLVKHLIAALEEIDDLSQRIAAVVVVPPPEKPEEVWRALGYVPHPRKSAVEEVPQELQVHTKEFSTVEPALQHARTQALGRPPFDAFLIVGGAASDYPWLLPRQDVLSALRALDEGVVDEWRGPILGQVLTEALAEVRNARNSHHRFAVIAARWKRAPEKQDGSLSIDFAPAGFANSESERDDVMIAFRKGGWSPIGLTA